MVKWYLNQKRCDDMSESNSVEAVLREGDKLSELLKNRPEVLYFKQCEEKLQKNERVQALLKQIRQLQKEAVNLEHLSKREALKQTSVQLQQCQNELDAIPLVSIFFAAQEEVNLLFQRIADALTFAVADCMKIK